ncbi:MAG: DUF459 domain-containing protein [Aliihoeflea sp.]
MFGTATRLALTASLAIVMVVAAPAPFGFVSNAQAQQQQERSGGGLLRFLFGSGQSNQPAAQPAPPPQQQRRATQQRRQTTPAVRQTVATVEKSEDATKVLIVGDFVAGGLADGLETAFAENPDVIIASRTSGSSGLVRADYFDWPGRIGEFLEAENPKIVIVMVGANDRQQIVVDGRAQDPRSEAWNKEYEARAARLAAEISDHGAHLVWVGTVPFRFRNMTSDMIAFNDLFRRVVEDAGGEYVDVWGGFVDEDGNFTANGPDMNGQPAQLRAEDGINLTRAGRRKLAFYLEKPLNRLLTDGTRAPRMVFGPELPAGLGEEDFDPRRIERTQPIALNDPALFGAAELAGGQIGTRAQSRERLDDAGATRAVPGRADDFQLQRPRSSPTDL